MQSLTAANVRKTLGKSALINIVTDSSRTQMKREVYFHLRVEKATHEVVDPDGASTTHKSIKRAHARRENDA